MNAPSKTVFFTAGPAQLHPSLQQHIAQALTENVGSISHRSEAFMRIFRDTTSGLRKLYGIPKEYDIFFFSSATEVWERLLQNCVSTSSFHFVNGAFSERFFTCAKQLGVQATKQDAAWGEGIDLLGTLPADDVDMINFTHNESSTGVMMPMEQLYALRKQYPKALFTLDVVSSAPYPTLDWAQLDAVYFSVQKAFGLPAGLGVGIFSPQCVAKAKERRANGAFTGSYHDFAELKAFAEKAQTPETPNVLGIYLLGKVIGEMLQQDIEMIRKETDIKADLLYRYAIESDFYRPFVQDKALQSRTVIVLDIPVPSQVILERLAAKGFELTDGYGKYKGKQLRIANFPTSSMAEFQQLIAALEDVRAELENAI